MFEMPQEGIDRKLEAKKFAYSKQMVIVGILPPGYTYLVIFFSAMHRVSDVCKSAPRLAAYTISVSVNPNFFMPGPPTPKGNL